MLLSSVSGYQAIHGVRPGARADLTLYRAREWPEVLRLQEPPVAVWFRGREVARSTVTRTLLRDRSAL